MHRALVISTTHTGVSAPDTRVRPLGVDRSTISEAYIERTDSTFQSLGRRGDGCDELFVPPIINRYGLGIPVVE